MEKQLEAVFKPRDLGENFENSAKRFSRKKTRKVMICLKKFAWLELQRDRKIKKE